MNHNPSLRQEARYEPASVIPLKQETSLLSWLEANGRLIPRQEVESSRSPEEEEEFEGLIDEDAYVDEDDTADTLEE